MGFLDFLFGNKEKERLMKERQAEQERLRIAEEKRIAEERATHLEEERRKANERKAKIESENSKKFQILDFYLDCSHWRAQQEKLKDTPLSLPIKRIDVEEDEDIREKYKVNSLPKLILVDLNGKEIYRWKGITEPSEINEYLYSNGYAERPARNLQNSGISSKQKMSHAKANCIDDIFKKGFRFAVDRYEEWANQKCANQGKIEGVIFAEVIGNKIIFKLKGMENLDIVNTISMDLSNPMSQVLKSQGNPLIQSDRVQYVADAISPDNDVPFLCHLFCENGRIMYVRFAFVDPESSSLFPMTKRIYEFYGDMIELSDSQKKTSQTNELTPFVFKSTCHQRYENIIPVMGLQQCVRTVIVEKNISGCSGYKITPGDGYIVKVFNNDVGKPNMSDKPMRIKSISKDIIVLQGYPLQAMSPFGWMDVDYQDYGLEVHYKNGEVEKCILHMYDRDTYIEYRK